MLRIVVILAIVHFSAALRAQSNDPHAHSSIGVPRRSEDTVTYRASGGFGGNLGRITDAPLVNYFELTRSAGDWFYGTGLNLSQSVTNPDTQQMVAEFDLLFGYSWNSSVPHYEERASYVHFALASGLAIENYSVQARLPGIPGIGPRQGRGRPAFQPIETITKIGLPLQFSAIYEFWKYLGIGGELFYTVSGLPPNYGGSIVLEARY